MNKKSKGIRVIRELAVKNLVFEDILCLPPFSKLLEQYYQQGFHNKLKESTRIHTLVSLHRLEQQYDL